MLLDLGGDAGYMTGFMMQKGYIVICGDAGEALADSMYEGTVFVGGEIASLGNDAVVEDADRGGRGDARTSPSPTFGILRQARTLPQDRRRAASSGTSSTHELETWRHAL